MATTMGPLEKGIEFTNLAASLLSMFGGRFGGGHNVSAAGGSVGFLTSLVAFAVRVYEESGGSKKDESELLESLFNDPAIVKSEKLGPDERKKVADVMAKMTPAERKVLLIALMIMNPKVVIVETAEKKDKDGKVTTPATKRTEETGVDPRVNVLRGIAEHVTDDPESPAQVAEMLRGTGALGSDNKALKFMARVMTELKNLLCSLFAVDSIDKITPALVKAKASELLVTMNIQVPDLKQPGPPAGLLVRTLRPWTPGAYNNAGTKRSEKSFTLMIFIGLICAVALLYFFYGALRDHVPTSETEQLLNAYQPTLPSADKPVQ